MKLNLEDCRVIARTEDWKVCVARLEGRWIGVAIGEVGDSLEFCSVFPEVSANGMLGLASLQEAIRLTSALADDPEQGLGEVVEWLVADHERGDVEDYRCSNCGELGCDGAECL